MKCLVTGGAGFIGSHIVDKLILLGHDVVCIDNESAESNDKFYWNDKASNFKFDICEYDIIEPLFENVDVVYHLASDARIQIAINNPERSVYSNVIGTFNILQASKKHNVGRVIMSSTSSVYGKLNAIPNVETQKEDCLTPYSVSKIFGENMCKVYNNLYGLQTICLRYFNVYGDRQPLKGQYAPVVGLFLKQRANGDPLTIVGDGNQRRDFTHISDVISANICAGFDDAPAQAFGQSYNIGYGENYAILDIARMVSGTITFIDSRPGEARETLSDTNKFRSVFNWKPKQRLDEWIREELNDN